MLTTTESIANQLSSRRTLTIKHQHHHRQRINHNSLFSLCCSVVAVVGGGGVDACSFVHSFHFVEMLFFLSRFFLCLSTQNAMFFIRIFCAWLCVCMTIARARRFWVRCEIERKYILSLSRMYHFEFNKSKSQLDLHLL